VHKGKWCHVVHAACFLDEFRASSPKWAHFQDHILRLLTRKSDLKTKKSRRLPYLRQAIDVQLHIVSVSRWRRNSSQDGICSASYGATFVQGGRSITELQIWITQLRETILPSYVRPGHRPLQEVRVGIPTYF
jgi:hypothetical protein